MYNSKIIGLGHYVPGNVVTNDDLSKLMDTNDAWIQERTGIEERRWWPTNHRLSDGAIEAAKKSLSETGINVNDIGAVVYTGVCRDQHEPATACRIAAEIGVNKSTAIYDISNACLGVLSGMLDIANRIELGQIKAGLVVSCESARHIVDITIDNMLSNQSIQNFSQSLATLTGGSGATAILLTDGTLTSKFKESLF